MLNSTIKPKQKSKNHIHDKFFREFFSCLKYARDFLIKWLPDNIKQDTDFDTLALEQNDFNPVVIGSDEFIADLIFSADRKNKKTKHYFIIEHKSYFDLWVPFQLYTYQFVLWLRLKKNLKNNSKNKSSPNKLPMVYLILVHQAKCPLNNAPDLKNLIDAPAELIENYFLTSPILIDLAAGGENLTCFERWMRDYHKPNPLQLFKETAVELMEMRSVSSQNYFCLVDYIIRTQSAETIKEIELFLQSHKEETMRAARKDFVSYADELIERGWKQGRQEGRWDAMLEMANALIQQGSSKELILKITGLSEQDIAGLCLQ